MAKSAKKRKKKKKKTPAEGQTPPGQASGEDSEQQESGTATAVAEEEARKAKKAEEESTHAKYERIKKGNLYLKDLQKLSVAELHDMAKKDNIQEYSALKKQDLIFRTVMDSCGIRIITTCRHRMIFMSHLPKSGASVCGPETLCQGKSGPRKIQKSTSPFCVSKPLTMKTRICSRKRWYSVT